jgi:hypothetical protein
MYINSERPQANVSCPMEQGEHTVVQTVMLPKEVPPGYNARLSLYVTTAYTYPQRSTRSTLVALPPTMLPCSVSTCLSTSARSCLLFSSCCYLTMTFSYRSMFHSIICLYHVIDVSSLFKHAQK